MKDVDYDEAIRIMSGIKKETSNIGIVTDRGWDDDPTTETTYSIIKDGHGQKPLAYISKDTFDRLRKNNEIDENCLLTYKARTFHLFRGK